MAYSAILIPHLEAADAEVHATLEETSWIGEYLRTLASDGYRSG